LTSLPTANLEALLAVQALDTELDQCRYRRSTLPERAELVAIAARLTSLEGEVVEATAARDEVAVRQDELERTLASVEGRAAEIKKRLYGGMVSATRELQAMAGEVDQLTARASELESRALETMEEREPLDGRVDTLQREKGALVANRSAVTQRLAGREAEVDAEADALNVARAEAAAQVPDDLVATYEKLRQHLGGTGIARLVGTRCGGCHLTLPATALDDLRHAQPGQLTYCEQCGRILVPTQH
jgi:uncharacterized protein